MLDVGQQEERIGTQLTGKQRGREVLVDDRLDAPYATVAVQHDRNAATAGADHEYAGIYERTDRLQLDDPKRLGRGHDPPPAVTVAGDAPSPHGGELLGHGAVVDGPDRLGRGGEGRVLGIDHDLGEQRAGWGLTDAALQSLLEQVADHALRLGPQHIQGVCSGALVGLGLERQQSDLGPVAVGNHDAVFGGELGERVDGPGDVAALALDVERLASTQQGVAAERCYDEHSPPACAVCASSWRAGTCWVMQWMFPPPSRISRAGDTDDLPVREAAAEDLGGLFVVALVEQRENDP